METNKITKNILVTGLSGSGKTYLSKYFKKKGVNCFDADLIRDLGIYVDANSGKKLDFDSENFIEYPPNSKFVWDLKVLKKFLSKQKGIVVFGLSSNCFDSVNLFDEIYVLKASWKTLLPRLVSPERDHPTDWGKRKEDQIIVKSGIKWINQQIKELRLKSIDATKPPQEIFGEITRSAGNGL